MLALTTRASIIGGAICIALLLLVSALCPETAAGQSLQEGARATNAGTSAGGPLAYVTTQNGQDNGGAARPVSPE